MSSIRSRRPGAAKAASAQRRERPWLRCGAERPLVALLLAVKFMLTSVVDAAERLLVDDDEVPGWHCESKRSRRARNLHFAAEDHSNG
jgi:hypothetical protein